jgi:transposase
MGQAKKYDREYKEEAMKLVEEKGCKKASEELGISYHTLYDWIKQARKGNLHLEKRSDSNVSKLEEELQQLCRANKEQAKEIRRLQEENEFLAEATAFFAASRQKSAKRKE